MDGTSKKVKTNVLKIIIPLTLYRVILHKVTSNAFSKWLYL